MSDGVVRNALGAVQCRIDNGDGGPEDVFLTVFNPSLRSRSEVVTAEIDLPASSPCRYFQLRDQATGQTVPVQVASRKPHTAIANHLDDAPANFKCEQFVVHFPAGEVPGLGYRTYKIERGEPFATGSLVAASNTMENEHLRVRIETDGTLTVTEKGSGLVFRDLNYFLDNGEAGHAWMHHDPYQDRVIDSRGFPVRIALEECGPALTRYRVECRMEIPARLEENGGDAWQRLDGIGNAAGRSEDTVPDDRDFVCNVAAGCAACRGAGVF